AAPLVGRRPHGCSRPPPAGCATLSLRDALPIWAADKDKIEQALGVGKDKAHYRKALEQMGYHITAVNYDKPDYLEYEIVKGKDRSEEHTSELQSRENLVCRLLLEKNKHQKLPDS